MGSFRQHSFPENLVDIIPKYQFAGIASLEVMSWQLHHNSDVMLSNSFPRRR